MNHPTHSNALFVELIIQAGQSAETWDNTDSPVGAMKEALALIEGGKLDYTVGNEEGLGVVRPLLRSGCGGQAQGKIIERMIHQGLNPLVIDELDLQRIFNNGSTRSGMILALVDLEKQGRGMVDAEGGNLLYTLARLNSDFLSGFLRPSVENYQKNRETSPSGDMAWVTQERSDGSTFLHYLWSREFRDFEIQKFSVGTAGTEEDIREVETRRAVDNLFITSQLVELGADILKPNQAGLSAWDLMAERDFFLLTASFTEWEACNRLISSTEARILDGATPGARNAGKPGMRL